VEEFSNQFERINRQKHLGGDGVVSIRIKFNGREYNGVEEMPAEVRRQYQQLLGSLGQDADGNGIPDALERPRHAQDFVVEESITYNGRKYQSRDELPPEVREMLARLPALKPGETHTELDVRTEPVSSEIIVSGGSRLGSSGRTNGVPKWLVLGLLLLLLLVLGLWLSGIRPDDLWRH
jgi:hypothetical protein